MLHLSAKCTLQEDPVGVKNSMEASLWPQVNSQWPHSEQIILICYKLDSLQINFVAGQLYINIKIMFPNATHCGNDFCNR